MNNKFIVSDNQFIFYKDILYSFYSIFIIKSGKTNIFEILYILKCKINEFFSKFSLFLILFVIYKIAKQINLFFIAEKH